MGSLWNRSGTIERDRNDMAADGALAYFFDGGTTTPLTVYSDAEEASPHEHPVEADARGRFPDIFVPYTLSYDVRVTDKYGTQITYSRRIPNPDPIELTVTNPPVESVRTGMIHPELGDEVVDGYVRLNMRTIGNGTSLATERANDDTEDLFIYLWNRLSDTLAPVSGGRGVSAAVDFAANKVLQLPDGRAGVLIGLDTMGNSAASGFAGLTFTLGSSILPGSKVGSNTGTLTTAMLPAHSHTGTAASGGAHTHTGTTNTDGAHTHTTPVDNTGTGDNNNFVKGGTSSGSNVSIASTASAHSHAFTTTSGGAHTHTLTIDNTGSGAAVPTVPKALLVTWYIKL